MVVPARNFVLLWLLSRETGLWLRGNEKSDLKWNYALGVCKRNRAYTLRRSVWSWFFFSLITHKEHHLLFFNQEAMSIKWLMPYTYPTFQLLLEGHLCPLNNKPLAGSIQDSTVAACLPHRGLWEEICLTAPSVLAVVEISLHGRFSCIVCSSPMQLFLNVWSSCVCIISHCFCHTEWC